MGNLNTNSSHFFNKANLEQYIFKKLFYVNFV